MNIENMTILALWHVRFRDHSPECLASLTFSSNKDWGDEWGSASSRSASLHEVQACAKKPGRVGVRKRCESRWQKELIRSLLTSSQK